jgi:hypothetical protein
MEITDPEMPPWLSLPEEVRRRVFERMQHRYGGEGDERTEDYRQELRDLAAHRLIQYYGLKKAMRKGRDYPAFGPNPQAWIEAALRTQKLLLRQLKDPLFMERARWMKAAVAEELAKYRESK